MFSFLCKQDTRIFARCQWYFDASTYFLSGGQFVIKQSSPLPSFFNAVCFHALRIVVVHGDADGGPMGLCEYRHLGSKMQKWMPSAASLHWI